MRRQNNTWTTQGQHKDDTRATCTDLTWLSFLCFLLVSVQSARQHPGSCAMYKSVRTRAQLSRPTEFWCFRARRNNQDKQHEGVCATKTKSILRNDNFAYHLLPSNKLADNELQLSRQVHLSCKSQGCAQTEVPVQHDEPVTENLLCLQLSTEL